MDKYFVFISLKKNSFDFYILYTNYQLNYFKNDLIVHIFCFLFLRIFFDFYILYENYELNFKNFYIKNINLIILKF